MRFSTFFFHTKSVCILYLSSHGPHSQHDSPVFKSRSGHKCHLCVSLPEEDKGEVGARSFTVWPGGGIEQKPISKFYYVSHVLWYHFFLHLVKTSLADLLMYYKCNIYHLDQTPISSLPTPLFSVST